ncbi:MAG: cupin domain-containing protein [Candidatus Omnitrophica bacterium]|nr:cupin domain-containing protein [Candidatus Omnitrophota bacterium]
MKKKIKTEEELSKEWTKKGFSCDLWVDPPGQRWEDYVHDVDEVVYVKEGKLEFEIGDDKKILEPGDEAFIPARANHSVRNIGGTTARWYYGYKT